MLESVVVLHLWETATVKFVLQESILTYTPNSVSIQWTGSIKYRNKMSASLGYGKQAYAVILLILFSIDHSDLE